MFSATEQKELRELARALTLAGHPEQYIADRIAVAMSVYRTLKAAQANPKTKDIDVTQLPSK